MRTKYFFWALVATATPLVACSSVDILGSRLAVETLETPEPEVVPPEPEELPNVLELRRQISLTQVNALLNEAFLQLFFGDPDEEAVFRDLGDGTGYIEDIAHNDVRTDSLGYGMLVTVELDQRDVFDKLWSFTKQHMTSPSGASQGLLRWRCDISGDNCDPYSATDASSIIVTSLLIAESRWGEAGAHNYEEDGLALLDLMAAIETRNGGVVDGTMNLFDEEAALPRGGSGGPVGQTPTDYLMPAFYQIWAEHDSKRSAFWTEMATNSRGLLARIPDETTGLLPELIDYEGNPIVDRSDYRFTTSRSLLNTALDHSWNGPHASTVEQNQKLLDFFLAEGIDNYVTEYQLDGTPLTTGNSSAHRALVALAAGTIDDPDFDVFLQALLDEPIPSGMYRYYDGMLYILSLLALSGQMTPG